MRLGVSKLALERCICRESFFDFTQRFWSTIIPEEYVGNWHIEYLCNEFQTIAERVFRRRVTDEDGEERWARLPKDHDLIVNISPGTTKSTLFSVMAPVWCWTRDQTIRTICGSYSDPLSLYLASQSSTLVRSDKFQALFPDIELIKNTGALIVNASGGQRISTSTGGTITGMHGHIIVIDDPLNPKQAASDVELKNANDWFDQTLNSRKVDKAVTPTILIMQRLHQDDCTGHILEKKMEDVKHICLPGEESERVRPRNLRQYYKHGLFDPNRLSRKVLAKMLVELNEYGYAGQVMQSPIPAGGAMFKTDKIELVKTAPPCTKEVRYWDKAGTMKDGCFTVGTRMGKTTDKRHVVKNVVRGQWRAEEREAIIKQTAKLDGKGVVVWIEQEPGSGGLESAQATVKNLAGFRVGVERPKGDKEFRAEPFATQVNMGNVLAVIDENWTPAWIGELRYFPFGKYKDQVDSGSGAFAALNRSITIGAYR